MLPPVFPQPNIVLSRCIEHASCRWDGQMIENSVVRALKPYVNFQVVCPEVEIGLPVPRDPLRVVETNDGKFLFEPSTGRDLTSEMGTFVTEFIRTLEDVDGFIFKSKSPSCGVQSTKIFTDIYAEDPLKRGAGLFGGAILQEYPWHPIEEERNLIDITARELFFARIFTTRSFREVNKAASLADLEEFHLNHADLLNAFSGKLARKMDELLSAATQEDFESTSVQYEQLLYEIFCLAPYLGAQVQLRDYFPPALTDIKIPIQELPEN